MHQIWQYGWSLAVQSEAHEADRSSIQRSSYTRHQAATKQLIEVKHRNRKSHRAEFTSAIEDFWCQSVSSLLALHL